MAQDDNNKGYSILRSFAVIVKEIGLLGFITIFCASIFMIFSSSDQKQKFIDHYILLEPTQYNLNCYFVVLSLFAIIAVGFITYRSILKAKKSEIKRLGGEKEELQKRLLK